MDIDYLENIYKQADKYRDALHSVSCLALLDEFPPILKQLRAGEALAKDLEEAGTELSDIGSALARYNESIKEV